MDANLAMRGVDDFEVGGMCHWGYLPSEQGVANWLSPRRSIRPFSHPCKKYFQAKLDFSSCRKDPTGCRRALASSQARTSSGTGCFPLPHFLTEASSTPSSLAARRRVQLRALMASQKRRRSWVTGRYGDLISTTGSPTRRSTPPHPVRRSALVQIDSAVAACNSQEDVVPNRRGRWTTDSGHALSWMA